MNPYAEKACELSKQVFLQMNAKNRLFSLRAFAKKAGISPSYLSELWSKRKRPTSHIALRLINALPENDPAILELKSELSKNEHTNFKTNDQSTLPKL